MRNYLQSLHKANVPVSVMDYETAMQRAGIASSFILHPYWAVVSRMLSGTIQAETEQLLAGDDHRDINRASVAMCRKILSMPFFDIEQGRLAESEYKRALASETKRRINRSGLFSSQEGL